MCDETFSSEDKPKCPMLCRVKGNNSDNDNQECFLASKCTVIEKYHCSYKSTTCQGKLYNENRSNKMISAKTVKQWNEESNHCAEKDAGNWCQGGWHNKLILSQVGRDKARELHDIKLNLK